MSYNLSDYFILSSSVVISKGYNRSLIHDFSRNSSNLISNEYFDLIEYLDRKKIDDVILEVEDDSKDFFFDFLSFMYENEYALFVNDIELFPKKSRWVADPIDFDTVKVIFDTSIRVCLRSTPITAPYSYSTYKRWRCFDLDAQYQFSLNQHLKAV